jgi:hypothetical protein
MPIDKNELAAQIVKWEAEQKDMQAADEKLHAELLVQQRRHEAYNLVKHLSELRGVSFSFDESNKWRARFEQILTAEQQNERE